MAEKIKYGMFGDFEIDRDDDGYMEVPVIIQASGLYVGYAPPELRIHAVLSPNDLEFNKQWVAKLNRRTDLPYYLGSAKIRIIPGMQIVDDYALLVEGIDPLEE